MRVLSYETDDEWAAARAAVADHLNAGGLLAYPTETVYGLGCGLTYDSLEALADFKGRRPFLLLIRDLKDASDLEWTDDARHLADAFWPGPLTLAMKAGIGCYPAQVLGPDGAVAVRVSSHPAAPALLEAAGGPITSTSANQAGRPAARDGAEAADVGAALADSGASVLVLDGGRLPAGAPSTIVHCGSTTRLIREGAIPRTDLETHVELA